MYITTYKLSNKFNIYHKFHYRKLFRLTEQFQNCFISNKYYSNDLKVVGIRCVEIQYVILGMKILLDVFCYCYLSLSSNRRISK